MGRPRTSSSRYVPRIAIATALPLRYKVRGLRRKYLFRKALKGRVPDAIIERPKKGFGFPVSKWLRGEIKDLMLDLLSERRLFEQGLFNATHVTALIREHLEGTRDHRKSLWPLLIYQLWHDRYQS